jgi:NarL family two-component system response regulator LiaR
MCATEAPLATNEGTHGGPRFPDQPPDVPFVPRTREDRISVLVVDSQTLFREGLARLLGDDERLLLIGVSAGHRELPEMCAAQSVDVVLVDLDLREMNGIELTRQVTSMAPSTRVLLLASTVDWRVIPSIASGAAGFLLKDSDPEAIGSAVVAVHLGENVLCREATAWLIEEAPTHRLTKREIDVLRMVAAGANNHEIAEKLGLRQKTVRNYLSRLYRKLASQSRAQLATYALEVDIDSQDASGKPRAASPAAGAPR